MAKRNDKTHHIFKVLAFLGLLAMAACTQTQEDALIEAATMVSNELDDALVNAPQLTFAGKVTSPDSQKWLNNYVAIVYKDGQEVGRDISKLGELPESGEGKHDGLFFIEIQNTYDLVADDLVSPNPDMAFQDAAGVVGVKYIYTWLGELPPGHRISFQAPSKRIEYILVIIPKSLSDLPFEFRESSTELTADDKIIVRPTEGTPFDLVLKTAASPPPPTTEAPTTETIFSESGNMSWTRTVSGFYGSRWDAWVQYVEGQVPGITWEDFKEETLRYNPDLEADGYAFLADKEYLFPEN